MLFVIVVALYNIIVLTCNPFYSSQSHEVSIMLVYPVNKYVFCVKV